MRTLMALLIAVVLSITSPVFASVGIWETGSPKGAAADIEFTGTVGSFVNGRYKIPLLLAGTANGGSTSMTTTDTAVSPSFSLVQKEIGVQVGLAGTMIDGSPGQFLTVFITARAGSGTFILSPTTTTGFTSITFDAAEEYATFLYVDDTVGWIVIGTNATIDQ